MVIYPGETELHEFYVPFPASTLTKAVISYKQNDYVTLEVTTTEFEAESETSCIVKCSLTQAQTLQLRSIPRSQVQLNLYTGAGYRLVSEPIDINVGEQFHRKIIS